MHGFDLNKVICSRFRILLNLCEGRTSLLYYLIQIGQIIHEVLIMHLVFMISVLRTLVYRLRIDQLLYFDEVTVLFFTVFGIYVN